MYVRIWKSWRNFGSSYYHDHSLVNILGLLSKQSIKIQITIILIYQHCKQQILITNTSKQKFMNKEKLIALIIKKETYKDTKPIQADIFKKKQEAVNVSISAIYHILKDQYNAEAKLYAVRYLKDCFEKGNENFILKTQNKILPILVRFVEDSHSDKEILKYGGSYTKSADLQKFKALVTSLFIMSRECIEKWGYWINDSNRGFVKSRDELARKYGPFNRDFQYFRRQNQVIFRQNCLKNKVNLPPSKQSTPIIVQKSQMGTPKESAFKKAPDTIKPSVGDRRNITQILQKIETNLNKMSQRQFQQYQAQFNAAMDQYLENNQQFDEQFASSSIDYIEGLKDKLLKSKIKENKKAGEEQKRRAEQEKKRVEQENRRAEQQKRRAEQENRRIEQENRRRASEEKKRKQQQKLELQKKLAQIEVENEKKQSKNASALSQHPSNNGSSHFSKSGHEERVNFEVSESEEQEPSEPSNIKKTSEFQKSTAKFILDQQKQPQNVHNKPQVPIPPKKSVKKIDKSKLTPEPSIKQLPIQASYSRVEFQNSISRSQSNNPSLHTSKQPQHKSQQSSSRFTKQQLQRYRMEAEQKTIQKQILENKVMELTRQIAIMQDDQKKRIGQLQNSTSQSQVNMMKKQLLLEKKQKNLLVQEVNQLKNEIRRIAERKTERDNGASRISVAGSNLQNNLRTPSSIINESRRHSDYKVKKIKDSYNQQQQVYTINKPKLMSPPQNIPFSNRIDQDYIDNKTHYSHIGSWLSHSNVQRFKLCVLGLTEVFYEDENIRISKIENLFSEDSSDFLKMTYSYKFTRCQNTTPSIKYKNMPEIDLWIKSITGKLESFIQETVGKLCTLPLKIMKGQISAQNNFHLVFLLPFMYYNYLRPSQFNIDQFQQVFRNKHDLIIKSKVFYLNDGLADSPKKYAHIFKGSHFYGQCLHFCLEQESYERVFMIQIQFLKNQKAIIRILPIPTTGSMATKTKQLLNNLVFLLASQYD